MSTEPISAQIKIFFKILSFNDLFTVNANAMFLPPRTNFIKYIRAPKNKKVDKLMKVMRHSQRKDQTMNEHYRKIEDIQHAPHV